MRLTSIAWLTAAAFATIAPQSQAQTAWQPVPADNKAVAAPLVTQDNLSKELLKDIYETALMPVSYDSDGDVTLRDGITTWAFPNKDRVRLMAQYSFKPGASLQQKLALANRINDDYIVIRAIVSGKRQELLKFDYYLLVAGGVTRANLVTITRRFSAIVPQAVKEHDSDDIVK